MFFRVPVLLFALSTLSSFVSAAPFPQDTSDDLESREPYLDDSLYVRAEPLASIEDLWARGSKLHRTLLKGAIAARPGGGTPSKAEKQRMSQDIHNRLKKAGQAHKQTGALPGRKTKFQVPNGGPRFTGKDARIANFNSHLVTGREKAKNFKNRPNVNPPTRPLPKMKVGPKGKEFPIVPGGKLGYLGRPTDVKGPARIIQQPNKKEGKFKSTFQGVISHDITRGPGAAGVNDHFKVKGRRGRR